MSSTPSTRSITTSGPDTAHHSHQQKCRLTTIEKYIKDTGAPFMIREVKANTFSNQPKAITTFGNHTLLSVHKSFPEDLAYEFVKTWLKMGPEIGKYSAIGQIWNPETIGAVAKIAPERLHPGARRAYIEAGLLKE